MGLLYLFPIQEDEGDHVSIKDSSLLLKSYGLPYLFWGYLLAGLTTLGIITLAIRGPLKKMLLYEDSLNVTAHTSNFIEGKVTAVPLDEIGRRQRGATEACFLHVAESDEADDCQDRQGGEQLPLNFFLGALTLFTLGATAVAFTSLFFVEFRIFKKKNFLIKSLYCFWIPLRHHRFQLSETHPFEIIHFYGSPNMARLEKHPGMQGHQNRGHFELYLHTHDDKRILLDRHSRKIDLKKLQDLLEKF